MLAIGTAPDYGKLGGALFLHHIETEDLEAYVEIIPNQSVRALAYKDGILYGGSDISGGLGSVPVESAPKIFAFDLAKREIIWEISPFEGYSAFQSFVIAPNGSLWGAIGYEIFELDLESRKITANLVIASEGTPYLQMGNDGFLYVYQNNIFSRLDIGTKELTVIHRESDIGPRRLTQDMYGNFYMMCNDNTLRRISVPSAVIKGASAELNINRAVVGEPVSLSVEGVLENGKRLIHQESKQIIWHSTNPNVISINDGELIAVGEGASEIYGEIIMDGQRVSTNKVTVSPALSALPESLTRPLKTYTSNKALGFDIINGGEYKTYAIALSRVYELDGYTLKSYGMLFSDSMDGIGEKIEAETKMDNGAFGILFYGKGVIPGKTYYSRAYAIYEKNGDEYIIYGRERAAFVIPLIL